MVAGPSKGPDRNPKPSTATSTSTCTSTITVFVDVDVLVHVDVFFKSNKRSEHTPENVKLLLPPRQSRGISQLISWSGGKIPNSTCTPIPDGIKVPTRILRIRP